MSDKQGSNTLLYGTLLATALLGAAILYFFFKKSGSSQASGTQVPSGDYSLYETLTTKSESAIPPTQQTSWSSTDVGRMMNVAQTISTEKEAKMLAVSNGWHQVLQERTNWRWSGKQGYGQTGAKLLDDNLGSSEPSDSCECMYIAYALLDLFRTTTPYGLKLVDEELSVKRYAGDHDDFGFIAKHAGRPLRNDPNIYSQDNQKPIPYYLWADHKTVKYVDKTKSTDNTTYYDPSYGTTQGKPGYYKRESEMAAIQIQGYIDRGSENYEKQFPDVYVLNIYYTDNSGQEDLRGFYIQCSKKSSGVLATSRSDSTYQDSTIYFGPFNFGDSKEYFGYDPEINYLDGITRVYG